MTLNSITNKGQTQQENINSMTPINDPISLTPVQNHEGARQLINYLAVVISNDAEAS